MEDQDISDLLKAVIDRQTAVSVLLDKYLNSESAFARQLVTDIADVFSADRLVFEAIITALTKCSAEPSALDETIVKSV